MIFTWISCNSTVESCVGKNRDRQSYHLTRLWLLAEMILVISGSHSTRSASEPTAMRPLRGNRLKILAAFVLVTATNWFSSILPVTFWDRMKNHILSVYDHFLHERNFWNVLKVGRIKLTTHLSQIRDILSSVPLVPSGIRVKSSLPMARWEVWKVQWALPVTCKSPLGKKESKKTEVTIQMCNKKTTISAWSQKEEQLSNNKMQLTAATHAKVVFQLLLHPGTEHLPWQQRAEIVRGGGIRTERRRSDEGCSFGPVLAPVMGAVCAQAGRDGLSVNHSTYRIREVDVKSKKCKPEKTQGKV